MGFRADVRAACVTLLSDYATANGIRLQVYPGRPHSVMPPTAFVDVLPMQMSFTGPQLYQQRPLARIVCLWGKFDDKSAVDQADAFVDGFVAYVATQPHAAGANTLIGGVTVEDIPVYVPDWYPANTPDMTYFASVISLEGYAEN